MSIASHHEGRLPAAIGDYAAGPAAYFALLKPRVMSLVIWTALAGLLTAPAHVHPVIAFASLLAIAVGAGAAGALNMWWEVDIDTLMARTRLRPIPSGLIEAREALFFGLTLALVSVLTLALAANLMAAALLAFTIFFYAVVYTMWLKRLTPQNIVIGGAAGALPPVVGCAAATGSVTLDSLSLFAIIFIWTPPHFWALALVKSADYARAGVPMMPNARGHDHTRLEILVYALVLVPVAMVPWAMGMAGAGYAVVAAASGLVMAAMAARVYRIRDGAPAKKAAMQLFGYSILHLFLLFTALVVEHGFGLFERFGL
ncbi:MAG: heme o synthase [Roseiarcus sp.]|jgi:heme o synthase